jgi:hypothetical protein
MFLDYHATVASQTWSERSNRSMKNDWKRIFTFEQ